MKNGRPRLCHTNGADHTNPPGGRRAASEKPHGSCCRRLAWVWLGMEEARGSVIEAGSSGPWQARTARRGQGALKGNENLKRGARSTVVRVKRGRRSRRTAGRNWTIGPATTGGPQCLRNRDRSDRWRNQAVAGRTPKRSRAAGEAAGEPTTMHPVGPRQPETRRRPKPTRPQRRGPRASMAGEAHGRAGRGRGQRGPRVARRRT